MDQLHMSNRSAERASGAIEILHLPWPAEYLGEYGSGAFDGSPVNPAACDRAMDRYIAEHLVIPEGLAVLSIIAGRAVRGRHGRRVPSNSPDLKPCIVVAVADEQTAAQVAGCVADGVTCYVSERHAWLDGTPAS